MIRKIFLLYLLLGTMYILASENLDRGLIAIPKSDGTVYLGWRMFKSDPLDIVFNVYRKTSEADVVLLGTAAKTTDFVDEAPLSGDASYYIVAQGTGIDSYADGGWARRD